MKRFHKTSEDDRGQLSPSNRGVNKILPELRVKDPILPTDLEGEGKWGEGSSAETAQKPPTYIAWFVLSVVTLSLLGWWLIHPVKESTGGSKGDLTLDSQAEQGTAVSQNARKMLTSIESCIKGYFAADRIADISFYTRSPKRVQPMMINYYKKNQRPSLEMLSIQDMKSMHIGDTPFVMLNLNVQDKNQKPFRYPLILEQTGKFDFKVDWEMDIFYQPISWGEYLHKRPIAPVEMRVIVQKGDYYDLAFSDQSVYQCYKLTSVGGRLPIYAYATRGGEAEKSINALLTMAQTEKTQPSQISTDLGDAALI